MTQPREGETVLFTDREGNPVTDPKKATSAEVIDANKGMHKVMVRDDGKGDPPKDPWG